MTEPSGGSGMPRRPVAVPVAALLIVAAVGITALLGGLEEVEEPPPPPLSQGAVLDQALYSTKFVEARVTVEESGFSFEEDKRFVELLFDVTNLGDETMHVGAPPEKPSIVGSGFANSLIKITPPIEDGKGPFTYALAKEGQTSQLHPGVTTKVVVRFRLDEGERPPEKVTLDVAAFEHVPGFQDQTIQWQPVVERDGDDFQPAVKARVTLPVKAGGPA